MICSRRNWFPRCLPRRSNAEDVRNPQFFGAGGPKMAAAGVELAFDLTQHSVIGISDVLKNYFKFRRLFNQLLKLAIERKPDVIIGVDFGGFNLRFGHAIKEYVRNNPFSKWNPKIVQFVSPQVWASRPGRANLLAADYDLLLSIFPFEKDWYAQRVPKLRVEFVGHPMVGTISEESRVHESKVRSRKLRLADNFTSARQPRGRIAPAFAGDAWRIEIDSGKIAGWPRKMVLPNPALKKLADKLSALPPDWKFKSATAAGTGRSRCRHRLDRHGDDGVRVFWRADGDAL